MTASVTLDPVLLQPPGRLHEFGREVLQRFADAAAGAVGRVSEAVRRGDVSPRTALLGRVRGTGPGVSFGLLARVIEVAYPAPLRTPFEGSTSVAGAVLDLRELLGRERGDAFLKLRFAARSVDLPMHAHETSDRFILVVRGRGFFHVSPDPLEAFTATSVRTVAVRERDVLVFPRGTVHTFSTTTKALHLLSYHAPHIPLDDPRQYTLPENVVCPGLRLKPTESGIMFDPAWNVLV